VDNIAILMIVGGLFAGLLATLDVLFGTFRRFRR